MKYIKMIFVTCKDISYKYCIVAMAVSQLLVLFLFHSSLSVPNIDSTYIIFFIYWLELTCLHQDSIISNQRWIMMGSSYSSFTSLLVVPLCTITVFLCVATPRVITGQHLWYRTRSCCCCQAKTMNCLCSQIHSPPLLFFPLLPPLTIHRIILYRYHHRYHHHQHQHFHHS